MSDGLWAHQQREWLVGRDKRARALIWPMRSGKSRSCIQKACYQYEHGRIRGVIVVAPNGVHLNWAVNEIPKWGQGHVHTWETPKRADFEQMAKFDAMLSSRGLKWFCINMEALKHLDCRRDVKRFLAATDHKFMLIVSEAHHFGHAGSKRTYFARSLGRHAAFRQIETGTPITNGPLRSFSEYEILQPGALGFPTYTKFQKHFADFELEERTSGRRYPKLVGYKNMPELTSLISKWSSVVLREDIHDMPALIRTERLIVMSEVQRRAYLEMVSHHLIEIGDSEVDGKDAGARVQKLQQILNGYVMKDGAIHTIDPEAPIYAALMDEIEGTLPGKSLVWCRYREDIRRVTKLLHTKWGPKSFVEYHGGIIDINKREAGRIEFNTDHRKMVCVGQPTAGGEGRDFSGADAVIFFSSVPNALAIQQAEERATVKGGRTVSIVRIRTPGTVDDRNWEIIDGNIAIADSVAGHGLRDLLRRTDI